VLAWWWWSTCRSAGAAANWFVSNVSVSPTAAVAADRIRLELIDRRPTVVPSSIRDRDVLVLLSGAL
jgi:hypothetical protein